MLMGKENGVVEPWLNRHSRVQWYPAPLFTSHTDGNFFYLNLQFKRKINHWRKRNTRRGIHAHTHTHTHTYARKRVKKKLRNFTFTSTGGEGFKSFFIFSISHFPRGANYGEREGGRGNYKFFVNLEKAIKKSTKSEDVLCVFT